MYWSHEDDRIASNLCIIILAVVLAAHTRIQLELHDLSVPGCWVIVRLSLGECFEVFSGRMRLGDDKTASPNAISVPLSVISGFKNWSKQFVLGRTRELLLASRGRTKVWQMVWTKQLSTRPGMVALEGPWAVITPSLHGPWKVGWLPPHSIGGWKATQIVGPKWLRRMWLTRAKVPNPKCLWNPDHL